MPKDKKPTEGSGREGQRPNSPKNFDDAIDQKQGKRDFADDETDTRHAAPESEGEEFTSGAKGKKVNEAPEARP